MWSILTRRFLATCLLATAAHTTAQPPAPPDPVAAADSRLAGVRALLQPWDRPAAPGVAVAVTLDGRLAASLAVGSADLEHGVAITPSSVFHAASVSKQFTAFAIVLLEQDGKLAIDEPLARYLPEAAALGPVTLRQLLNQTNGLRDQWTLLGAAGWRSEDLVTDAQVLALLLDQRGGNFPPGSAYQYTNSGYSLLAEVVRRVSGQSLRDFCTERIFGPLGMRHTQFQDDVATLVPARVQSYTPGPSGYARQGLNYATAGPSGLLTTAEDLGRWALNLETPTVGGRAAIERMQEQGVLADGTVNAYALGQERRPYKGLDSWSHGGRDAGYRSFLLRIPGERFSVAVLSNAADFDTAKLAFAVADLYLSSRPAFRSAAVLAPSVPTPEMAAAYAGDYELFPGLIFSISADAERLFFAPLGSRERVELQPRTATSFLLNPGSDIGIEFPAVAGGRPQRFSYRIGLHGALPARRIVLASFAAASTPLEHYLGHYYSAELRSAYELKLLKGQLVASHPRRSPIALWPYQTDTFASSEWFFQRLVFQRDGANRVNGFRLSGAVAEDIVFKRLDLP